MGQETIVDLSSRTQGRDSATENDCTEANVSMDGDCRNGATRHDTIRARVSLLTKIFALVPEYKPYSIGTLGSNGITLLRLNIKIIRPYCTTLLCYPVSNCTFPY